ncbi:hypothetical protein GGR52DRAFT_572247 [Hypoxylon sp. FL1284]|nr:hypothetical protein GGR52DRAFT_572247 [Hypoxylon sp. FL1284]
MSHMSRNNSSTALMGFSVHQPMLGAPLQFFPAMGSKQLDDMIDAYVPGTKSILDKRADVSMEFYQHVCQTGDMFKFFMVYPSLGSTGESPASSMLDSGYVSNFTSPVMSESQWTQASTTSFSSTGSRAPKSSSQQAASSSADFSSLPGMKILTRDGKDVTNSASRGCKTKEQRDHAHLMRIIKACDACRRKKVRCDPSHRKSTGSSGTRSARSAKTTKKAKKAVPSTTPSEATPQFTSEPLDQSFMAPSFDPIGSMDPSLSFSFDSDMSESLVDPSMEWEQFFQYNEEPSEAVPVDYDFLYDPARYSSVTSSNSLPSSQPISAAQATGADASVFAGTAGIAGAEGLAPAPLPPYLNPGGEAGNDYADFNLYSPGSSISLDDDPTLIRDITATSGPSYAENLSHQRLLLGGRTRDGLASLGQTPDVLLDGSTTAGEQVPFSSEGELHSPAALGSSMYLGGTAYGPIQRLRSPGTYGNGRPVNAISDWQNAPDGVDQRLPVQAFGLESRLRTPSAPSSLPSLPAALSGSASWNTPFGPGSQPGLPLAAVLAPAVVTVATAAAAIVVCLLSASLVGAATRPLCDGILGRVAALDTKAAALMVLFVVVEAIGRAIPKSISVRMAAHTFSTQLLSSLRQQPAAMMSGMKPTNRGQYQTMASIRSSSLLYSGGGGALSRLSQATRSILV